MNSDCEQMEGPCACGAWHSKEELKLLAQLSEAKKILEDYSGPNKMSETEATLLRRFMRFREAACTFLERLK